MARRRYTDADRERVQALAQELNILQIARLTGIPESTLRYWQKRSKVQFCCESDRPGRKLDNASLAKIDEALAMAPYCTSWLEVARAVGVSGYTINSCCLLYTSPRPRD